MKTSLLTLAVCSFAFSVCEAQSELYPQHFNLNEVTLLEGPMKQRMDTNDALLLKYDADRLMTPFIRQAGLTKNSTSKYYNWESIHPSFTNWGLPDWSLEGHVGGHYLTALALAYAATDNAATKAAMKERLDYCLNILNDCQKAYANNTSGLKGFIGGQPINQVWTGLYAGNLAEYQRYGGWVPFYCQHKVLAGLRDAYLYTGSNLAKELFRGMADWSVNVVAKLTTEQMQNVLGWEHGGMNETLADAYTLLGDKKYLDAAKKYSHQMMVDGLVSMSPTFLNGKHANTQVPKYIGFERVWQQDNSMRNYRKAVLNFWTDVTNTRTVCIGGNSVSEHFLNHQSGRQYIDNLDGPESCNSNNMLKLTEDLFDDTHDAKYADFYESTMWNHIMSTQDPETGGYVYFTSLRPQSYRIYSQVNQGMWCCVGTGMENHGKYGHFIYTHSVTNDTLYVNLFTASELKAEHFGVKQETSFPFEPKTKLTLTKGGNFTLAIRQPSWASADGKASYTYQTKQWKKGDVVEVNLPMTLRYEPCPDYTDYVAFKYGPILLAARSDVEESLQNEYGGEGRMDHAPGSRATIKTLSSAPLLIGERNEVLDRIQMTDASKLQFTLQTNNKGKVVLEPFYDIHHSRYTCYFYQATEEDYAQSEMGKKDAAEQALLQRTLDFVATGEQQSEAGHEAKYSLTSNSGSYRGETYRDAPANGFVQYTLENKEGATTNVSLMLRLINADNGRKATLYIDGKKLTDVEVVQTSEADDNGFYNVEYRIPDELLVDANGVPKQKLVFKAVASASTLLPGLYYLRLLKDYNPHNYVWKATDWRSGDEGRVPQSKLEYNADNTLTVRAGTGANNVCLTMDYKNVDGGYYLTSAQKYFVVVAQGTTTTSGASYLWWLNGVNKASSVAPVVAKKMTPAQGGSTTNGDCLYVWNMSTSGLNGNNVGDRFSICQGSTILGLTAATGTATIKYIGFATTLAEAEQAVGLASVLADKDGDEGKPARYYDLSGRMEMKPQSGHIYIVDGQKKVSPAK